MVVRTTDRILVTEEQLQKAIGIVEDALAELGLAADIEVAEDWVPEDVDPPDRNVLHASVREEVDVDRLIDAIPAVAARLREAGLGYPVIPLIFTIIPGW